MTPTSVLLNGVPAEAGVAKNGELKLNYSRQLVSRTLAPGADVPLVISGPLRGQTFVSAR